MLLLEFADALEMVCRIINSNVALVVAAQQLFSLGIECYPAYAVIVWLTR